VVHGLRGRASNRKLPAKTQKQALAIFSLVQDSKYAELSKKQALL
jgi:hypothetical protein